MSTQPDEYSGPDFRTADEVLHDSLMLFTANIGEALDVCSYGLTIGESYVPFDPDDEDECEDGEAACTQAWVRVMSVGVIENTPMMDGNEGCAAMLSIDLEVGIIRCLEMPDNGEAPKAADMLVAATQSMTDMQAIYCAAMEEGIWDALSTGSWTPMGPLGGQYGGMWTFTVEGPIAPPVGSGVLLAKDD